MPKTLIRSGHQVEVLCKAAWASSFACHPLAAVHGFGADGVPSSDDPKSLGGWIRRRHYDHLLIPYRDRRLFAASWRSGVPHRWAQLGGIWSRLTLHRSLPAGILHRPRHMADVWLDFARALSISVDDGHPELFLSEQEVAGMADLVRQHFGGGSYVVIHPFHGRSSCNWPTGAYVNLALRLREHGVNVVMTGQQNERTALEPEIPTLTQAGVWVSCGQFDLRQFFALIGGARLLVCSSTGALHVSSALQVPSLSLFCPHPLVNDTLWHSFARGSKVLSPSLADCPRTSSTCQHCQFSGTISVDLVLQQCLQQLSEPAPAI